MADVKIMVTELPEYAWECPFSEIGSDIGSYDCKLTKTRMQCSIICGMNCTKLVEGRTTKGGLVYVRKEE